MTEEQMAAKAQLMAPLLEALKDALDGSPLDLAASALLSTYGELLHSMPTHGHRIPFIAALAAAGQAFMHASMALEAGEVPQLMEGALGESHTATFGAMQPKPQGPQILGADGLPLKRAAQAIEAAATAIEGPAPGEPLDPVNLPPVAPRMH